MQWPSEYMLIDRIKPSDSSSCHGLLEIWSKKRTLTQERLNAAQLPGSRIGHCTKPHTLPAMFFIWPKVEVSYDSGQHLMPLQISL